VSRRRGSGGCRRRWPLWNESKVNVKCISHLPRVTLTQEDVAQGGRQLAVLRDEEGKVVLLAQLLEANGVQIRQLNVLHRDSLAGVVTEAVLDLGANRLVLLLEELLGQVEDGVVGALLRKDRLSGVLEEE
jgi:hypothetical protein